MVIQLFLLLSGIEKQKCCRRKKKILRNPKFTSSVSSNIKTGFSLFAAFSVLKKQRSHCHLPHQHGLTMKTSKDPTDRNYNFKNMNIWNIVPLLYSKNIWKCHAAMLFSFLQENYVRIGTTHTILKSISECREKCQKNCGIIGLCIPRRLFIHKTK